MKDYTKYDFPRIFNSRVYVEYTNIEGKKDCMSGILLTQTQNEICIQDDVNHKSFWAIEKNTITYLNAQIKVEDMTLKQLKRFAKIQVEPSGILDVVIRFKEKRIEIFAGWDEKRCVHLFSEQHSLDEYIDCTDWGWEK